MNELVPYPLHGELITGDQAWAWLTRSCKAAEASPTFCTAFLRSEAFGRLLALLPTGVRGTILTRWRLEDLLAGASDLNAYTLASEAGWPFFMRLDFHGKVFEFPGQGVLVGSANATLSGLGLASDPNVEAGTLVRDSESNKAVTSSFFHGATLVDVRLFRKLEAVLNEAQRTGSSPASWPQAVLDELVPRVAPTFLLVSSCLLSKPDWVGRALPPSTSDVEHDLALLRIPGNRTSDPEVLASALSRTAIYAWLVSAVEESGGEAYFGRLSAHLHSCLADDPAPQRRDVKSLLQNILEWLVVCGDRRIVVDRPNHSQRVRLIA
jgi:hypothetical protein